MHAAPSPSMALRLLYLSMHAMLATVSIPLLASPAAAATGDTLATGGVLRGLYAPLDTAAATRTLLHGNLKPWQYPTCPRCRLISLSNGWWSGHCKSGGKLFTCRRSASSLSRLAAPLDGAVLEVPPEDTDALAVDVGAIVIDGEAPAPYVACSADGECELPSSEFVRVNGSAPLADGGTLQARCVFPATSARTGSFSGVCICGYSVVSTASEMADGVIANATATSTRDSGGAVVTEVEVSPGRGRSRTPRKASRTRTVVEDFCVRKARRVVGPKDRDTERYVHDEHARIGPRDALAPAPAAEEDDDAAGDGVKFAGVTVSDATVGAVLEDFDTDYVEPPAADNNGTDMGEAAATPPPPPPPPVSRADVEQEEPGVEETAEEEAETGTGGVDDEEEPETEVIIMEVGGEEVEDEEPVGQEPVAAPSPTVNGNNGNGRGRGRERSRRRLMQGGANG